MEAFRSIGIGGEEARCGNAANCSATEAFSMSGTTICANQDDLPSDILANTDSSDKLFVERACCTPTNNMGADTAAPFVPQEEDVCVTESLAIYLGTSDESKNLGAIIGGSVGGVVFVLLAFGWWYGYTAQRKKEAEDLKKKAAAEATNSHTESSPQVASARAIPEEEEGPVPIAVTAVGEPAPSEASAPPSPRTYTIGHKAPIDYDGESSDPPVCRKPTLNGFF